jgi:hypothetical protein
MPSKSIPLLLTFSKHTPNKLGDCINENENQKISSSTLTRTDTEGYWRVAIADQSIDTTKIDDDTTTHYFSYAVRIDEMGDSRLQFGFTPMETFDSTKDGAWSLGDKVFVGVGFSIFGGNVFFSEFKFQNVIDRTVSEKAKEIVVILAIKKKNKKKVMAIRVIVDGVSSAVFDCTEYLKGDKFYPAICMGNNFHRLTMIPINQVQFKKNEMLQELIQEQINSEKQRQFEEVVSRISQLEQALKQEQEKSLLLSTQLVEEKIKLKQSSENHQKQIQKIVGFSAATCLIVCGCIFWSKQSFFIKK